MRTVIMILILLNAALATVGRPQPSQDNHGPFSCCRGSGPDAYCCFVCCVHPNCDEDEDCL